MARGIYSALGRWPEIELRSVLETLCALADRINAGQPVDAGAEAVVAAIRRFEARVGCATGLQAGMVSTPRGPAIEIGNVDHHPFGAEHEDAAVAVVSGRVFRQASVSKRDVWARPLRCRVHGPGKLPRHLVRELVRMRRRVHGQHELRGRHHLQLARVQKR